MKYAQDNIACGFLSFMFEVTADSTKQVKWVGLCTMSLTSKGQKHF
jgi:hypothetical protein